MNIFVLNTGRCGSMTFIEACRHITNFSSGHHSRCTRLGDARLDYPPRHIEADNRLSWFLGRLDQRFGNDAFYVHLTRDDEVTAKSFVKRFGTGIIHAYTSSILMRLPKDADPMAVSLDYCDTVNANIRFFLRDKIHKLDFRLENAKADFRVFWDWIGAEGDLEAALAEFDVAHNAGRYSSRVGWTLERIGYAFQRLLGRSPQPLRLAQPEPKPAPRRVPKGYS